MKYLLDNNFTSQIVVVDKTLPQLAWLSAAHKAAFEDPRLEFRSCNLINAKSVEVAMQGEFEHIINLAAETRVGQFEEVYEEGILKLSLNCARVARRPSLKRYVELSCVMSSSASPSDETCKMEPWSAIGRNKARVEKELERIQGDLTLGVLTEVNFVKCNNAFYRS